MFCGLSDKEIAAIPNYRLSLRECWRRSGRGLYPIALEIGMLESHLSRALSLNDGDNRTLSDEKRIPFMVACGNYIPWRWLVLRMQNIVPPMPEVATLGVFAELNSQHQEMTQTLARLHTLAMEIHERVVCGASHTPGAEQFSLRTADRLPDALVSWAFDFVAQMDGR